MSSRENDYKAGQNWGRLASPGCLPKGASGDFVNGAKSTWNGGK